MKDVDRSLKPSFQHTPKVLQKCPLCASQYHQKHMHILEEDGGAQLVHVTCDTCQQAMLAYVVVSHVGMSSIGMLTDLTESDVLHMLDREPLSDDDVLSFHEILALHQHDFIHLLNSKTV